MNLMLVSGKLSDLKDATATGQPEGTMSATFTERRWSDGTETEIKWFVFIPRFSAGFAKKCVDKSWKVFLFVTDVVSFTTPDWTDAGYMAYGNVLSIQL